MRRLATDSLALAEKDAVFVSLPNQMNTRYAGRVGVVPDGPVAQVVRAHP